MGQGKAWAIHEAQEMVKLPFPEALVRCEDHVFLGEEAFNASVDSAKVLDARAATRFGAHIGSTITNWFDSEGEVLPPYHIDFGVDLSERLITLGSTRFILNDFDPSQPRMSSAVNRLRAVRLGLPEVLRAHKPEVGEVEDRLKAIRGELGRTAHHAPREKSESLSHAYYRRPRGGWLD